MEISEFDRRNAPESGTRASSGGLHHNKETELVARFKQRKNDVYSKQEVVEQRGEIVSDLTLSREFEEDKRQNEEEADGKEAYRTDQFGVIHVKNK
jgi:hypothetical protein